VIAYMTALAGSSIAQKKYGARHDYFAHGCSHDEQQIQKMARKVAKSDRDIPRLIDAVERRATELVNKHWRDIEFIATALRRLGDYISEDEIQPLLKHVGTAPVVTRSAPPPPETETLDGVPYRRRVGYLRAA